MAVRGRTKEVGQQRVRRGGLWSATAALLAAAALWGCAVPVDEAAGPRPGPSPGELAVHFIDVGQGDATLLVAPGATVLVDAGRHTGDEVVRYLEAQHIGTIDVVAITHPHADHLGGFSMVMDRFDVAEVWWSPAAHTTATFADAVQALEASDATLEEPRAGDKTTVGPLRFAFANPPPDGTGDDLHDRGLVFRVAYGDVAFVFTGDAEQDTERRIVTEHAGVLRADVYQVGHHGSATSTSPVLLEAVSPRIAVYSAGRDNPFGHPHGEVLARLEAAGVAVYGTPVHGTVVVTSDGSTLEVDAVAARGGHVTTSLANELGDVR